MCDDCFSLRLVSYCQRVLRIAHAVVVCWPCAQPCELDAICFAGSWLAYNRTSGDSRLGQGYREIKYVNKHESRAQDGDIGGRPFATDDIVACNTVTRWVRTFNGLL